MLRPAGHIARGSAPNGLHVESIRDTIIHGRRWIVNSTFEQALQEVMSALPTNERERVLEYARARRDALPRGTPGRELLKFAGTISSGDLQVMTAAIEAGCERVDTDD